ncbi:MULTISPECIES: isoprenyl transferase [Aerococcus]|uniref:Isoprenyl transferase n=1 Tax=Aerococcus sanguinicola TaxID=119206 RepID=A0A5N1GNT5_9LACT|nr:MULTISPECIES: isoprenyl transferase [Aerococcus]KAA9301986.1 isoprenyl transferase [Aerococcus sanguinicola]MDK6368589.1 isoprenyl transferase [Aerococcus sp. UMB9870]MDK6686056.1 isoprenyl transferase [Aerococcus sp. UMB8623]MDK6940862.1 isoprenyl transferase [Aerococcus sp. UMB8487]OFK21296.1 isoprenyl transferase [Aerococcus sp. HMSC072A12]
MTQAKELNPELPLPQHVAIIMDGNGRWAEERGLKRTEGHKEGLNALKRTIVAAAKLKLKVLTVYAFSTENWARPKKEVQYLMSLPHLLNQKVLPELMENNVRVCLTGNREHVPDKTWSYIENAVKKTANNDGMLLNIAFNYGSRLEIVKACQALAKEAAAGELDPDRIDEEYFSQHLQTAFLGDLQDPDLLIRSSGEIRLSNYLLWQLAYSEFVFTDTKWPDFDEAIFYDCIAEFQQRQRRFGKV